MPAAKKCPCCNNNRWISLNSSGFPQARDYIKAPMQYRGIATRCPLCFSLKMAQQDKDYMIQYYFDEQHPVIRNRYKAIRAAIILKYPKWKESDGPLMYDREVIPVVQPGERCRLCYGSGLVCPGCTGGQIPSRLFMGCGVDIRCPWCVDYKGAMMDKQIFQKYEDKDQPMVYDQHCDMMRAVYERYPDCEPDPQATFSFKIEEDLPKSKRARLSNKKA